MTYATHAALAESTDLRKRVVACAAQEGEPVPSDWAANAAWFIVGSDWVAAVESAQANADYTGNPYADPAVITDQMILSAVQARRAAQQAEAAAAVKAAAKGAKAT
jgi:hypothetical protein